MSESARKNPHVEMTEGLLEAIVYEHKDAESYMRTAGILAWTSVVSAVGVGAIFGVGELTELMGDEAAAESARAYGAIAANISMSIGTLGSIALAKGVVCKRRIKAFERQILG